MNVYSLFPLVATIAYVPLIFMVISSRPWQRRNTLFLLFLVAAMMWSLTDTFFRGIIFPEYSIYLFDLLVVLFTLASVQFHCFLTTFYPSNTGRWLPFAYISLALVIVFVLLGYITEGVVADGEVIHGSYRIGVFFVVASMMTLVLRNYYVFGKMLRTLKDPVKYNQIVALILGISVIFVFTITTLLPWGKEFPLSHLGNLINALILTFAVIRHQLVDIKIILRQGSAWFGLGLIGVVTYWFILVIAHNLFDFDISLTASFAATIAGVLVAILIYRLRGYFFNIMSRVFHGASYVHRQQLSEFTDTIHNVFSLKEQGGELLALLVKAIGIRQAVLLFPETGSDEFSVQIAEPKNNELATIKLKGKNPIVKYLEWERKPLTKENLSIMPEFLGLWSREKEELDSKEIEILMPLISRDRLIAILILGKKKSGRYSLEEYNMIVSIADRVAVSMEKEYLSELLRQREAELSVINNCSSIIASSLNIQEIFGSFIEELKKIVDIGWASIVLIEKEDICFVALSSKQGTAYKIGEKEPIANSGTGWVIKHKKSLVIPDLSQNADFSTGKEFFKQGMLSVVYLPLFAKGEVIGSLILSSSQKDAYSQQSLNLLEQLAAQIAMPLENARLYAETEEKARVDELTGLLNRRSLDEMIDSEISRHSRYGGSFALAILDLDKFKAFNDTKGHLAGDSLLGQVGAIIKNMIRTSDYAFRYGGDEFAILLPQTTIEAAGQVTERVRESIANGLATGDIPVTASIGLARWPEDGMSHSDIIAAADLTLYRAKWTGGNRVLCSSGTLSSLYINEAGTNSIEGNNRTVSILINLAETIDSRSQRTRNHSKKVAEYAFALAKSLDINTLEIANLENCALLHDIGKISIGDEVLDKTEGFTDKELDIIRGHPKLGANIVGQIPKLAKCADGIRYHHEWYDGTGYPSGLKGDKIPLEARILAIANTFDILLAACQDSGDSAVNMALEEIKKYAGTKFDPYLVDKFAAIFEKKPVKTGEHKNK